MSEGQQCFEFFDDGRTVDIFGCKGHIDPNARLSEDVRDVVGGVLHSAAKPDGDLRLVVAPKVAAHMFDCGFLNPTNMARAVTFTTNGGTRGFDIVLDRDGEWDPLAASWPCYGLTTVRVVSHDQGLVVEPIEPAAAA